MCGGGRAGTQTKPSVPAFLYLPQHAAAGHGGRARGQAPPAGVLGRRREATRATGDKAGAVDVRAVPMRPCGLVAGSRCPRMRGMARARRNRIHSGAEWMKGGVDEMRPADGCVMRVPIAAGGG